MKKFKKSILFIMAVCVIAISSSIITYAFQFQKSHKYDMLTKKQNESKEDTKLKVAKMLADSEYDIISTFSINKNIYVKLELKYLSDFSQGKFSEFNDISFCNKASRVISNEMRNVTPNSLVPIVFINTKELIFAYKAADGVNFLKKYELKNDIFEKTYEDSQKGNLLKLD